MPPRGQTWTTLPALQQSHMNAFHEYEAGIIGIGAGFAIGQRAILMQTEGGNILWDCVATLDLATVNSYQGPRGPESDRDLASAFLHDDERMGGCLRLPDPS